MNIDRVLFAEGVHEVRWICPRCLHSHWSSRDLLIVRCLWCDHSFVMTDDGEVMEDPDLGYVSDEEDDDSLEGYEPLDDIPDDMSDVSESSILSGRRTPNHPLTPDPPSPEPEWEPAVPIPIPQGRRSPPPIYAQAMPAAMSIGEVFRLLHQ